MEPPQTLEAHALTLANRVAGVTATLRAGQVTAICGPNGAGKSSLLACLAGLLAPDSGEVRLGETHLASLAPRRRARTLGYLPQSAEIAWDVRVETLVALGRLPWQAAPLHHAHSAATDDAAAVDHALEVMELESLRTCPVRSLSGGERARALLARVLAGRPGWILADEPLAALDLGHAATLLAQLRAQAGQGLGVVLVLHDLAAAMNHADRVLVLDRGKLVEDATPADALSEATIAAVWGVKGRWLGEPGARALAHR